MTTTRQAGEAVAWQIVVPNGSMGFATTLGSARSSCERSGGRIVPLIPASDLEQVILERDEAVRLLREAPVVLLDRAVIELRDEPALRSYATQLAKWAPRAKALLSRLDPSNG